MLVFTVLIKTHSWSFYRLLVFFPVFLKFARKCRVYPGPHSSDGDISAPGVSSLVGL